MVSATYRCSNNVCDFSVRLLKSLPVWKPNTPPNLANVPVGGVNEACVARYADQRLCASCGKTVEAGMESCATCAEGETFLETGDMCPKCKRGTIESDQGSVF